MATLRPLALALGALLLVACPKSPDSPSSSRGGPCGGLDGAQCDKAQNLLAAAQSFGNVHHEYLLDPASAMVPGRGVEKGGSGSFTVLPTRCAAERGVTHTARAPEGRSGGAHEAAKVDPATIDFSYIGVAIDQALVSADADLAPWISAGGAAGERKISLVAVAFVRELDPQFFGASDEVAFGNDACTCGRATHFVGSVKMGGLISYEMTVKTGELRGSALSFVKARLAAGDARVTQTVVGGLEIDGLDQIDALAASTGSAAAPAKTKPLGFHVKTPVPIAYAVYPLADVCKFAFPAPDVSPEALDFGEVPYEREETRLLHVVNRASIDLRATVGERTFAVSALGSVDVPVSWRPTGSTVGCEAQTREDTLQFYPRDENVPVVPKVQSARIVSKVRTGKGTWSRNEHVDSGTGRKPDYAATKREWSCPPDYVVASCATKKTECGDGKCTTDGYAVNAEPGPNGCRFACKGPESLIPGLSANYCRFDAAMECRLRCGGPPPPLAPVATLP